MEKCSPFYILIFFILFLACVTQPEMGYLTSQSAISADNISNQHITCFGEDEFGYVWIGTNRGVNKYNGHTFLQFFHSEEPNSLSSNQSRQILSDSNGRLWVGTTYGINLHNKQGVFLTIPVESYSQNIVGIKEDKEGRIFVNTVLDICEYNPDLNRFEKRISFPYSDTALNGFHIDDGGRFWCVSHSLVYCYDGKTYSPVSSFPTPGMVHYSFIRKNGDLWLGTDNGIVVLDTKHNGFISLPLSLRNHPVLSDCILTIVYPYDDNTLLLNTQRDGLFLFDTYTGEILHQSDDSFPFRVPETDITVMFRDSNKNLWIGSYDQGFTVQYDYKQRFNANDYLRTQLEGISVISTSVDKNQNLWIATRAQGLKLFRQSDQKVLDIDMDKLFPENRSYKDRVNAVFIDSKDNIWLQTNSKLIRCKYQEYQLFQDKVFNIGLKINSMAEDHTGTIWAAGENMYIYYLNEHDEFQTIELYPSSFVFTNGLLALSGGKLLIASFNKTMRLFDPVTREEEEIDFFPYITSGNFIPAAIYEDSRGDIWVGTIGDGLFKCSLQDKKIEQINGLPCSEISSLVEDIEGNLWIGTQYGLCKYELSTKQLASYYKSDGIGGNQFNERSACRMHDRSIVFGGTHGLTIFDPVALINGSKIPLFVEELKIHNQRVIPEKNGVIETAMVLNPKVHLSHNQNSIQISYAALDYSEFQRVRYAYKLEGFDAYWIDANTQRQAFYSNLPAGNYTFMVKSMSTDNTVEEMTVSIPMRIKRAPWLSIPMLFVYTFILLGTVLYIFYLDRRLRVNRQRIQQAVYEMEQEQKINQMNMSFFANISHEFRTPLTMIAGPVNQLCNDPSIRNGNRNLLMIVQRSIDRMLRLINQLMDFNKLENDTMNLRVQFIEITRAIHEQLDIFRVNAEEKQIPIITYGLQNPFRMWVDTDVLQKVLSNLLSNALKFSKIGSVIDIHFDIISRTEAAEIYPLTETDTDKEYAQICIGDNGIGIPEDKLEAIFKRYYQVSNNEKGQVNWGTGIGLYYSRKLVEIHHGYIKAANKPEGGALFSFVLPVNMESYTKPERGFDMKQEEDLDQTFIQSAKTFPPVEPESVKEKSKNTLLIVDDDTEITYYLKTLLSPTYNVVSAFDAKKAWTLIEEIDPDLIISDIVMPETDGFSFCKRLKENISTCHIPVILLTAKAMLDDQVKGLNVGANAYVTKPFDPSYLLALVKSQLKNRDYARELLSGTTKSNTLSEEILNSQDMAFMDNLYKLMEAELSNPELNISRMTEVLHISRTKFYYKVKGLTGENPNVFFKTYKLNRAAELIRERKYMMAEIADMTGFSTASHFSASFKKKFGISPSEY